MIVADGGIAGEILVGGADQRVVALVGNGEADAAIGVLEEVGAVVVEQAVDDDVAALDQAHLHRRWQLRYIGDHVPDPRAAGVDEAARGHGFVVGGIAGVVQREPPEVAVAFRGEAARARSDLGATVGGVAGVQHHQAGIIDGAIGILEGAAVGRLQSPARHVGGEVDGARRRQRAAEAEVVIDEEAETDDRPRAQAAVMGQDEPERTDDVRGRPQQHLALDQRFMDETEVVVLEIAEAAMDELGRCGGRGGGEVALLAKKYGEPAAHGVAGDTAAVDAAADDGEIKDLARHSSPRLWLEAITQSPPSGKDLPRPVVKQSVA